MSEAKASQPAAQPGHEEPAVATTAIIKIAAGVAGLVVFSLASIALAYLWREGSLPFLIPAPAPPAVFAEPRLQIDPVDQLGRVRQEEGKKLTAKAALPIERAMTAIARRGADAYAPLVPPQDPAPQALP